MSSSSSNSTSPLAIGESSSSKSASQTRAKRTTLSEGTSKRISIACEQCRTRKRRCDGERPCGLCIKHGLKEQCQIRLKARPKRPLPVGFKDKRLGESGLGEETSLAGQVEVSITRWLAEQGVAAIDLTLHDDPLTPGIPLDQPLPGYPHQWAETLDTCLQCVKHRLYIFTPGKPEHLIRTFNTNPGLLHPDEMALVLSFLACGRQVEFILRQQEVDNPAPGQVREDYVYFQLALRTLDAWGQSSTAALGALHMLHWFAHRHGGPRELEAVLERMSAQCRLLGIHRRNTASLYPPEEKVGLLFYMSLYKDSWFSTLIGRQPAFQLGEYDQTWTADQLTSSVQAFEAERHFEATSFMTKFTLLENEALQVLSGTPAIGEDQERLVRIRSIEDRLVPLQKELGHMDREVRPMLAFAVLRVHWLRLMIHFPLHTLPSHSLPSTAVLARSACIIVNTYSQLAPSVLFVPKFAEVRRISTATYILLVCYIRGEMDKTELKTYAQKAVDLLAKSRKHFAPSARILNAWLGLMRTVGFPEGTFEIEGGDEYSAEAQERGYTTFDFTLPG